jgi:hypothetical protein
VRLGCFSAIERGRISSLPTTKPVTEPPKWAERSVVLVMESIEEHVKILAVKHSLIQAGQGRDVRYAIK